MNSYSNIYIDDYITQIRNAEKTFSPQQTDLRKNAISSFERLGFPTTKNEEWKYTNVASFLKNSFKVAGNDQQLTLSDIKHFLPVEGDAILLVFHNGKFNNSLSHLSSLPPGIIAGNLGDYSDHAAVKNHLGKIALHANESFVALNTALFQHGAFVFADKNVVCEKPIHLLFVNDARQSATVTYPRNLVVASPGSSIRVTESYYSITAENSSFCNPVTEIFVDENAKIEFCKIESENLNDYHIDYTSAFLQKNSTLNVNTVTFGGMMVRNNLRIELQKQNGSAHLNGLYVTAGESHVDNHSVVDHASPDCYSNEFYKGVLDGKSQGVFNGKILVRKDAQKTNAYQSNKNILLSDNASMNAKPQLEIFADDVKCSHGATTGQLDPEAMFYLRSRGIGEIESRALLTTAFAEEILDRISISSLREKLKDVIHSKLKKGND
jgi:Fe-S cluster assembly protein SufD